MIHKINILTRLRCIIETIMSKIITPKPAGARTELERRILARIAAPGRTELTRADLMVIEGVRIMTRASVHAALKNLAKARAVIDVKTGWRLA